MRNGTMQMSPQEKNDVFSKSLEKALQILCSFSFERQELSLAELSEMLPFSKSTVYRLASTLVACDFLRYDEEKKKYSLGLKLLELGGIVYSSFSIRKVAAPYLNELHTRLRKTVFLGIRSDNQLVYIDKREDLYSLIRFASQVGTRRPLCFGMLGQVLMAFLPESEVDMVLEKSPLRPFTPKSITEISDFKKRLREIRSQGFVIEEGEAVPGATGIAAPVTDYSGKVIAAVGVGFVPTGDECKEEIVQEVCKVAKEISNELRFFKGTSYNSKREIA